MAQQVSRAEVLSHQVVVLAHSLEEDRAQEGKALMAPPYCTPEQNKGF
jgi:hypothetical protein